MGDFSRDAKRIQDLEKKRKQERDEFEERRRQLQEEDGAPSFSASSSSSSGAAGAGARPGSVRSIDQMFSRTGNTVEDHLKQASIGLVTKEEYAKRREMFEKLEQEQRLKEEKAREELRLRRELLRRKRVVNEASKLSFSMDDDEDEDEDEEGQGEGNGDASYGSNGGWAKAFLSSRKRPAGDEVQAQAQPAAGENHEEGEEEGGRQGAGRGAKAVKDKVEQVLERGGSPVIEGEPNGTEGEGAEEVQEEEEGAPIKRRKLMKAPGVDTSFLPDRYRDEEVRRERERLAEEWRQEQARMKEEPLEITYSYWDGSGHRRTTVIKKGFSIRDFLQVVKSEFKDLARISVDDLMYIKEDLIIPHSYTFYHLIINKARGKSGPLFHFDVHEDVRLRVDTRVEKDESHPGKVVDRRWYERNKHVFPASRWEVYDPEKTFDKYTIHGD